MLASAYLEGLNGVVKPRSHMGAVALSVIGHSFDRELLPLMAACFPGFYSLGTPFLCSAGKVWKTGRIIADVVLKDNQPATPNVVVFLGLEDLESRWRKFADRLGLTDAERVELFDAVKAWVVADYRIDPTMNPADPDARRLVA